jgi:PAS domain-containing protein
MSLTTTNHETEAELVRLRQRVAALEERLAQYEASPYLPVSSVDIHHVLDALTVPVFYKDAEGRYVWCNAAFARFSGTRPLYDHWQNRLRCGAATPGGGLPSG